MSLHVISRIVLNSDPFLVPFRYVGSGNSDYYEGTGYGRVLLSDQSISIIEFLVSARTENGILFFTGDEVKDLFVIVEKSI